MTAQAVAARHVFRLADVGCYYGSNHVIEGVNMDIPEHEITAIIGPSGGGQKHAAPRNEPDERPGGQLPPGW